jgi:hypothetical protein
LTESKEYHIDDLVPQETFEICFVHSDANPAENLELTVEINGKSNNVTTDSEGKAQISGKGQTKLNLKSDSDEDDSDEQVSGEEDS